MSEKIYLGRPIDVYQNEELNQVLNSAVTQYFNIGQSAILDPKEPEHQAGYKKYRETTGNGMNYFFTEVLPNVTIGVFLAFADGMIGAGVWGEAELLQNQEKLIFEINRDGQITPLILDPSRKLTVEETRARVYKNP